MCQGGQVTSAEWQGVSGRRESEPLFWGGVNGGVFVGPDRAPFGGEWGGDRTGPSQHGLESAGPEHDPSTASSRRDLTRFDTVLSLWTIQEAVSPLGGTEPRECS